jgi:hypothetical protein
MALSVARGWRSSPPWFKTAIGVFLLVDAIAVAMAMIGSGGVRWLSVLLALLHYVVLGAIVATIVDIWAIPEAQRGKAVRSLAIGLGLMLMVAMFFSATIVRLGGSVGNRPL